ncbi:hypothetical protein Goari_003834 [Gossypium aridum]|uniref:Uncharacterized protein n=1 Tax=Gossypium aridum TaxID=34290 RepID=A0A7J8Y215_GOSAI|nr:hypothetical protein [Gossypium aridum]
MPMQWPWENFGFTIGLRGGRFKGQYLKNLAAIKQPHKSHAKWIHRQLESSQNVLLHNMFLNKQNSLSSHNMGSCHAVCTVHPKWSSLCQATTGDHCEEDLTNNVLVRLKQSLSIALIHFYPLAGRFATKIEQNPRSHFVDCNNSPGAKVIHAAVDISVPDIDSPTYVLLVVQSFFDHEGAINYDGHTRPLLSIQVTELVNGVFIGQGDNNIKISRSPVLERWFPEGDNGPLLTLPFTHQDEFITRVEAPHVLEKIFHFSAESIAKLKETANTKSNTTKISSSQFLTALLSRDWSHHCPHIALGTQLKLTAVTTAGELLEPSRG